MRRKVCLQKIHDLLKLLQNKNLKTRRILTSKTNIGIPDTGNRARRNGKLTRLNSLGNSNSDPTTMSSYNISINTNITSSSIWLARNAASSSIFHKKVCWRKLATLTGRCWLSAGVSRRLETATRFLIVRTFSHN